MQRISVVVAVILAVLLGACSGQDATSETTAGGEGPAGGGQAEGVDDGMDADRADAAAPEEAAAGDDAAADEQGPAPGQDGIGTGGALPTTVASLDQGHVIKEGTVTIRVEEGGFDAAFAEVMAIARRLGGGVAASETSTGTDGHTSGSLTVRVPVEAYEDLLVGVGDIGEVTDRRITAQDVSTEVVDLEARRRQLQAQEEFYLGLLTDATSVDEAVRVRTELDRIQTDIERISGRLAYLEDRTAFSTLTVELFEPGATVPTRETPARGLARYWETGLDALVAAVGTMLVITLGSLPLVLVIVAVLLAVRAFRRRPSPTAVPAPPAGR